jgi:hypothetical protein
MLAALLQWMDTEQLFAVLLEQDHACAPEPLPMARPPAVPDPSLLKKLVPEDLYRQAMQSGWIGMHALSFALRHRVTQLQLIFHLPYENVDLALRQCLLESWQRRHGSELLPIFGFSPLGVHSSRHRQGLCRAFDAFSIASCTEDSAPIFCTAHAAEDLSGHPAGGSQQALMFRYYADLKNFSQYGEVDLDRMIGAFWQRYRVYSADDLAEAMEYFGLRDAGELRKYGPTELRRKFLQLSLIHHPDRGGEDQAFVILQTHYHRLKHYLEVG